MNSSKLTRLAVITLLASTASISVQAQNSSSAELRGYQTCLDELAATQPTGLVTPRVYYIAKQGDVSTYYVNTSIWQAGHRVAKRLNCSTTRNGRKLLSFSSSDGRFARGTGSNLGVAKR